MLVARTDILENDAVGTCNRLVILHSFDREIARASRVYRQVIALTIGKRLNLSQLVYISHDINKKVSRLRGRKEPFPIEPSTVSLAWDKG